MSPVLSSIKVPLSVISSSFLPLDRDIEISYISETEINEFFEFFFSKPFYYRFSMRKLPIFVCHESVFCEAVLRSVEELLSKLFKLLHLIGTTYDSHVTFRFQF